MRSDNKSAIQNVALETLSFLAPDSANIYSMRETGLKEKEKADCVQARLGYACMKGYYLKGVVCGLKLPVFLHVRCIGVPKQVGFKFKKLFVALELAPCPSRETC
eukprot:1139159-Pelagomonas_calceolata.AAC.5